MSNDGKLRLVEVFCGDGWETRRLHEIKKGELFRMFESDGTQVAYDGRREWFATDDGFVNTRGTGSIAVDL